MLSSTLLGAYRTGLRCLSVPTCCNLLKSRTAALFDANNLPIFAFWQDWSLLKISLSRYWWHVNDVTVLTYKLVFRNSCFLSLKGSRILQICRAMDGGAQRSCRCTASQGCTMILSLLSITSSSRPYPCGVEPSSCVLVLGCSPQAKTPPGEYRREFPLHSWVDESMAANIFLAAYMQLIVCIRAPSFFCKLYQLHVFSFQIPRCTFSCSLYNRDFFFSFFNFFAHHPPPTWLYVTWGEMYASNNQLFHVVTEKITQQWFM